MDVELLKLGVSGPWPMFFAVGLLSGAMASLFGIGGGILITPFLNILGAPMPLAVATATPVIAVNASMATVINRKTRNLHFKTGILFAAFMIPAVEFCAMALRRLHGLEAPWLDTALRVVFVLAVVVTIPAIMKDRETPKAGGGFWGRIRIPPFVRIREDHSLSIWVIAGSGIVAGTFAGFLGLGGGRVIVPVLLITAQMGMKRSVGTSSFVIWITSLYTGASYATKGMVDFSAFGWLVTGAVPGALVGAGLLHRLSARPLRWFYLTLTVAALIAIGAKEFGSDLVALLILVGTALILLLSAVGVAVLRSRPKETQSRPESV